MTVRAQPCAACPYRKDVPSGVWELDEYLKLIKYDSETWAQPTQVFACHATPEFLCNGWAVCHSNRGGDHELLALRLHQESVPERLEKTPLFNSGTDAAIHGLRDIAKPSRKAIEIMDMLKQRYSRLRNNNDETESDS